MSETPGARLRRLLTDPRTKAAAAVLGRRLLEGALDEDGLSGELDFIEETARQAAEKANPAPPVSDPRVVEVRDRASRLVTGEDVPPELVRGIVEEADAGEVESAVRRLDALEKNLKQIRAGDVPLPLRWRGAWASGVRYQPGDVVTFARSTFVCTKETTRFPQQGPEWDLIAEPGEEIHLGGGSLGGGTSDHDSLTGVSADDHHAQVHDIDGPDHNGFPGGTTTFLRADGTFAVPPGSGSGHTIKEDGSALTQRTGLNFVDGLVATDDAGNDETDVNVAYGASGYPVDVAATEADGTAATLPRSDHRHAHGSGYLPDAHHTQSHTQVDHDAAEAGDLAAVAAAAAAGVSAEVPNADHVHPHGSGYLPDAHHAQAHTHAGDGSGSASHDDLTGVSADDHHAQSHVLATGTALGPDHSVSGAAAGEVLRALSATTAAFDQLQHSDLGGVTADQHHSQSHSSGDHDTAETGDLAAVAAAAASGSNPEVPFADHVHAHGSGYLPDAHHTQAHSITGADHSGFPGGTSTFLRADATFAAPPGGSGSEPTISDWFF